MNSLSDTPYPSLKTSERKGLSMWLACSIAMVLLMVLVGGLTRLTESGLSMVNWHPIHGILPPMNEAEWMEEFAHYQTSPEYQQVNFGMTLEEFQGIFWLEYIHRILGRLAGLVFAVPYFYFLARGILKDGLALKLGGILLLGGAQGLLGWYMVKSGLVKDPMVSPLRLTAHLGLACLLFSLLLWQWLRLRTIPQTHALPFATLGLIGIIFVQILLGALVAGLDAGLAYNTFPTMNGQWIPNGLWLKTPWWDNFYTNATTVQFVHRLGALCVCLYSLAFLLKHYPKAHSTTTTRKVMLFFTALLFLQMAVGIATLLLHVPLSLASLHQLLAIFLLGAAITLIYTQSHAKRDAL